MTNKIENAIVVEVPLVVSYDAFLNAMVSALEGGSNYWYLLDIDSTDVSDERMPKDYYLVEKIAWKLFNDVDFSFPVFDLEDPNEILGIINHRSCKEAIRRMAENYPLHFADFISGEGDADTGDVFFQLAVMGEIVFG